MHRKPGKREKEKIRTRNFWPDLLKISVPVLIIHGDQDTYVPYEVSREASLKMKNCDFVTISGANHGFGRKEEEENVFLNIKEWLFGEK